MRGRWWQVQLYVNDHEPTLNARILEELPELATLEPNVKWRSPLKDVGYEEYWDERFLN